MRILMVASEAAPIVKIGGLADVVGSLPAALKQFKVTTKIAIPLYQTIINKYEQSLELIDRGAITFHGKRHWYKVYSAKLKETGTEVFFFHNEEFLSVGNPYFDDSVPNKRKKEVNRFAFFSRVVTEYFITKSSWKPDIFHCHDWHTGMIPHLLKHEYKQNVGTIFTIQNLSVQGISDLAVLKILGHDRRMHSADIDFDTADGNVVFLLQGILGADVVTTVSPSYAKEITTPQFGEGLDKILREHKNKLYGIINGIDYAVWDPHTDPMITHSYNSLDYDQVILSKLFNKSSLYEKLGLNLDTKIPLVGIVSRLFEQKGFQLLYEVEEQLVRNDEFAIVALGTGDKKMEDKFRGWSMQSKFIHYIDRYDEALAHQIYAASDMILIPSKFEPCGLTQMIAMRYGTIPVVHAVGGLKDTVTHLENGFVFDQFTSKALWNSLQKAAELYHQKKEWKKLITKATHSNFTWDASAKQYALLYEKVKKTKFTSVKS
jgi:starch synthase